MTLWQKEKQMSAVLLSDIDREKWLPAIERARGVFVGDLVRVTVFRSTGGRDAFGDGVVILRDIDLDDESNTFLVENPDTGEQRWVSAVEPVFIESDAYLGGGTPAETASRRREGIHEGDLVRVIQFWDAADVPEGFERETLYEVVSVDATDPALTFRLRMPSQRKWVHRVYKPIAPEKVDVDDKHAEIEARDRQIETLRAEVQRGIEHQQRTQAEFDRFKESVVTAVVEHCDEYDHCNDGMTEWLEGIGLEAPSAEIILKFEVEVRASDVSSGMRNRARRGDADFWVKDSYTFEVTGDNDGGDVGDVEVDLVSIRLSD